MRGQDLGPGPAAFGASSTTIHLHFEIKQPITLKDATITANTPPSTSPIDAGQRFLARTP